MTFNRRQALQLAGAAAIGATPLARALGQDKGKVPKVLFFTKSSGFEHSVIHRTGDKLAHAERILTDLAKEHGFEIECSKDGRVFEPDKIGQYDLFAFETTGDLSKPGTDKAPPISPEGEAAFYSAIKAGKGFVGFHCATDTFGSHRKQGKEDPYIAMIGGEFAGHGAQQVATLKITDPSFPGAEPLGEALTINDEWYALKNIAHDLHVIAAYETEGMKGKEYQRPNFPETWARLHGKGRVFYTSMGHREDVWENKMFHSLIIGGMFWALGKLDADIAPNITKVTPGYMTMPA